jgi:hypothetical protein
MSVHSAQLTGGYPPERYAAYSECAGSERTGGYESRIIEGGGAGTVVRVSMSSGGEGLPAAERAPPAGSHRVLLKLRNRTNRQNMCYNANLPLIYLQCYYFSKYDFLNINF